MDFTPPIDLNAAWQAHVEEVLADRDPHRISASDLHSCDRAFWSRYHGEPQLPYTNSSFSMFERGHAYETRIYEAFEAEAERNGQRLLRAPGDVLLTHEGIEGHPDFVLYDSIYRIVAIIDPTTTASKSSDWTYGHALKSAWYANALGCDLFCEFVVCIGFGGNILKVEPHWFSLEDVPEMQDDMAGATWRERVDARSIHVKAISSLSEAPEPPQPPIDPLTGERESWRCEKGYCRAICPKNKRNDVPMTATAKETTNA